MAVYWIESWDTGTLAQLAQRYDASNLDPSAISASYGRTGNGCHIWNTGQWFSKLLGGNFPTVVVGYWMRPTSIAGSGANYRGFLTLFDSSTIQLWVGCRETTGQLQMFRGPDTANPLGSPSVSGLVVNAGVYVELVATLHPTAGVAEVYVNGARWANFVGNTRQTANNFANAFRVGNNGAINGLDSFDCDDLYAGDTRLGDCRVGYQVPDGAGASTQWTPVGAATNWQAVADIPANEATYVLETIANDTDLYTLSDFSTGLPTFIHAVQVNVRARNADAGARALGVTIRSGAVTPSVGPQALGTSFDHYFQTFLTDPATGTSWTVAGVNALQAGVVCGT